MYRLIAWPRNHVDIGICVGYCSEWPFGDSSIGTIWMKWPGWLARHFGQSDLYPMTISRCGLWPGDCDCPCAFDTFIGEGTSMSIEWLEYVDGGVFGSISMAYCRIGDWIGSRCTTFWKVSCSARFFLLARWFNSLKTTYCLPQIVTFSTMTLSLAYGRLNPWRGYQKAISRLRQHHCRIFCKLSFGE